MIAGIAAAAGSYLAVRSGRGRALDAAAARTFTRPLGLGADRAIGVVTDLGSVYGIAGIASALAVAGHREAAVDTAAGGLLAWALAQAAKPLLRRERPYESAAAERLVAVPAGSSWPSGHAAVLGAMAATLGRRTSLPTGTVLWAGAAAIGVSRLYVGVHHLTDLVAGMGVGVVSAAAWARVRALPGDCRRRPGTPVHVGVPGRATWNRGGGVPGSGHRQR